MRRSTFYVAICTHQVSICTLLCIPGDIIVCMFICICMMYVCIFCMQCNICTNVCTLRSDTVPESVWPLLFRQDGNGFCCPLARPPYPLQYSSLLTRSRPNFVPEFHASHCQLPLETGKGRNTVYACIHTYLCGGNLVGPGSEELVPIR